MARKLMPNIHQLFEVGQVRARVFLYPCPSTCSVAIPHPRRKEKTQILRGWMNTLRGVELTLLEHALHLAVGGEEIEAISKT